MRPIKLTVSGLHSFKEEQTVDFNALCEGGVFGIFGPTGSGKSSLLDAITLALYGKVERAAKNTQGILNHGSDRLAVSFTFELRGAATVQYQVERTYKGTKEGGLKIGSCRLIRMGEASEVLADKERDVTQGIQKILGLTHDDFTRAVVLPQGKFAEFLTLKGADRRKMLQRLFHLEKYGDELNDKLKFRISGIGQRLKEILAEQQGLGEASEEAFKGLQIRFAEINNAADNKKADLQQQEKKYDEIKQLWQWQQEWDDQKRKYEQLLSSSAGIEQLKEQLKLAESAANIKPYLEEWQAAKENETTSKKLMEEACQAFDSAKQQEEKWKGISDKARRDRQEKEPEWLKELSNLRHGKQIYANLTVQQQKLKEKNHLKEVKLKEAKKKETALIDLQGKQQTLFAGLKDLQKAVAETVVSSSHREIVRLALAEKQSIKGLEDQLSEHRQEWKRHHQALLMHREKLEEHQKEESRLNKETQDLYKKYEKHYGQVANAENRAKIIKSVLAQRIASTREEMAEAYREKVSLELSAALNEGEACPVCGSTHHPEPIKTRHHISEDKHEEIVALYENMTNELEQSINQIETLKVRLESQSERLSGLMPEETKLPEPIEQMAEDLHLDKMDENELAEYVASIGYDVKGYRQDILGLNGSLDKHAAAVQTNHQAVSKSETQEAFYTEQQEKLESKAKRVKESFEQKMAQWLVSFKAFDIATIEMELDKLHKADEHVEQLQKRYNLQLEQNEEIDKTIERLRKELNTFEGELTELKGAASELEQSISQQDGQLREFNLELTSPIDDLLHQVETRLTQLKKTEADSYEKWQKAQTESLQLDKRHSNAISTHKHAEERKTKALVQWEEKRKASGFADELAVQAAYLSAEQLENAEQRINDYQSRYQRLQAELERLDGLLDNRSINKEIFDSVKADYQSIKADYESLIEQRASLRQELETMERKRDRYQALEKERNEHEKENNKLSKLQQVFRGNGFVEFVAEEQLHQVCHSASKRLGDLTRQRYALEVDTSGGFIIRDDANGGIRRPVSSLSGGETFLTSLSLALSLSEQIQLSGDVPLQFFFLDEGFGTLDQDLLDTVVTALEKLHMNRLSIGVISHVPDLRARLARKLIVGPADPAGSGSTVRLETM
ncbi:exonuclease SbcC [Scopulibacillus darangshiensis]|uniref:Nuclease SbcCD subunit C n=1 Tax=Scopulibacillus darangshiensis TaxID=442528 RepID=A0A4R2P6M2_9BACL|nr:SMC family ATPase [Scopulibacillus darangshiensis]TCP29804.1 exonuclease SbcC [Scopulibacillus darangshiensis]